MEKEKKKENACMLGLGYKHLLTHQWFWTYFDNGWKEVFILNWKRRNIILEIDFKVKKQNNVHFLKVKSNKMMHNVTQKYSKNGLLSAPRPPDWKVGGRALLSLWAENMLDSSDSGMNMPKHFRRKRRGR